MAYAKQALRIFGLAALLLSHAAAPKAEAIANHNALSARQIARGQERWDDYEQRIDPYLRGILPRMMRAFEAHFALPHFGTPALRFAYRQNRADRVLGELGAVGQYRVASNNIFLDPDLILFQASRIDGEGNIENIFRYARGTLGHELGHFYTHKLIARYGAPSLQPFIREQETSCEGNAELPLISEGIAEYFGRMHLGEPDTFSDADWPADPEKLCWDGARYWYHGGYHLVKPIIDAHGRAGIEYLLRNPPTGAQLADLPKYQQDALAALGAPTIGQQSAAVSRKR